LPSTISANRTRYLEITIGAGDLIIVIAFETIEHVEQAKHVEGVGAPFAPSQAALNQDMIVVVIAVHFQECGATRRTLVQTSDQPLR
jgi:hypothetical protein